MDLCPTACTVAALPSNYFTCNTVTRTACSKYAVLIKCSYQFTDVTDVTEWTDAVASGDVVCLPPGNIIGQAPAGTAVDIDCDTQKNVDLSYIWDYETYQVSNTLLDYDFWDAVYTNPDSYRLVVIESNGGDNGDIFIVSDPYKAAGTALGQSPGFKFSLPVVPHPETGDGNLMKWVTQFRVKYEGVMCRRHLVGVRPAICG